MMRTMVLSELVEPMAARLSGADCEFAGASTDSRSLSRGDMFVALKGERFDGHQYLDKAVSNGAVAALVSAPGKVSLPQLVVADTERALGQLGAFNRGLYEGPLVAITGSSGKTTVKNMAYAILSRRGATLATEGNFNNEIGVPLTLLRLSPACEFAVVEMGAARRGDIAWLCQLGRPTVALLLNAMPAHLEGFGSVEEVAAAKGEIFDDLDAGAIAVINADQPWADQWRERAAPASIVDFSIDGAAAITASEIHVCDVDAVTFTAHTPVGDLPVELNLPGRHNVANALAAIAIGLACDLRLEEIGEGLASLQPVSGRLASAVSPTGARVIDDCYNANPGSVRAAIDLLSQCEGRRTLVLGEMRELGVDSESLHREMGAHAREAGLESFWGVGEALQVAVDAFGESGRWYPDRDAAIAAAQGYFAEGDLVLVKGSRGAAMEHLLRALMQVSDGGS